MLKVVIADDEARICRLVEMLADWESLGMEVAGTASNGLEALELIERVMPDILITDIRMPGCDGLQLIERARAIAPGLEIAIISGYAQFEYAQTAIRFGVGEYLLKPINREALTAALQKLGEAARKKLAGNADGGNHDGATASRGKRRERLVYDLLGGHAVPGSSQGFADDYGLPASDGLFRVFVLKMDYDPRSLAKSSLETVRQKAKEIFIPALESMCSWVVMEFSGSGGYGAVCHSPEKRDLLRKTLRSALNQLEGQKFFFGSVEFTLSLGPAVEEPSMLQDSLSQASDALAERLIEGTGRLYEEVPPPSGINARLILDKYSRGIAAAVEALSVEAGDRALDGLFADIDCHPNIRGRELYDLILSAGRILAARVSVDNQDSLVEEFGALCREYGNGDLLMGRLREFQRGQLDAYRLRTENEAIRPVRIAKDYIHRHYSQPITLEDVCAATGFSVSYFSTLFKKETGEGFSKYLTRVRIDRAKTLLQDTGLPVSEICIQVGYSDLKHFNTTFKKVTSLSPGQYRKLYG